MTPVRKHFVLFASPGTLVSEMSVREIASWDAAKAAELSRDIVELHGAKPFAFWFETRLVHDPIPDGEGGTLTVNSRTVEKSGRYFIEAVVETYDQLQARMDPKEEILRSNMRCNRWPLVCTSSRSFRVTQPFQPEDVVVSAAGAILARGTDPDHAAYRARTLAAWEEESARERAEWERRRAASKVDA